MSIDSYDEDTFVAFLDISGFKELMRNEEKALDALDTLYNYGYKIIENQNNECRVEGIFISDSCMLFVRNNNQNISSISESLKSLLIVIKGINERMREKDFMLTSSIAYGKFKYQGRIEFPGIEKNLIYGNAYVSAFLDNENGKPKIQPGQCRITRKNLPDDIIQVIEQNQDSDIFRMLKKRGNDNKYYYYYWMVNNPHEIKGFEKNYKDAYKLKYTGMLKALRGDSYESDIQ